MPRADAGSHCAAYRLANLLVDRGKVARPSPPSARTRSFVHLSSVGQQLGKRPSTLLVAAVRPRAQLVDAAPVDQQVRQPSGSLLVAAGGPRRQLVDVLVGKGRADEPSDLVPRGAAAHQPAMPSVPNSAGVIHGHRRRRRSPRGRSWGVDDHQNAVSESTDHRALMAWSTPSLRFRQLDGQRARRGSNDHAAVRAVRRERSSMVGRLGRPDLHLLGWRTNRVGSEESGTGEAVLRRA
jgi:hypothetical protein